MLEKWTVTKHRVHERELIVPPITEPEVAQRYIHPHIPERKGVGYASHKRHKDMNLLL